MRDVINSHKTAIGRNKISSPAYYLLANNLIKGRVLDYGCGRGFDADWFGWDAWDPSWRPGTILHPDTYDTIICSYVLNVLTKKREENVLACIKSLLTQKGVTYLTVRRNVKKPGYTKIGTYQRNVVLKLPVVVENSSYCMYRLTKVGS